MPSPRNQEVKWLVAIGYLALFMMGLLALCQPVKKTKQAEARRAPAPAPAAARAAAPAALPAPAPAAATAAPDAAPIAPAAAAPVESKKDR